MKSSSKKPLAVVAALTGMMGGCAVLIVLWTMRAGAQEETGGKSPEAGNPSPAAGRDLSASLQCAERLLLPADTALGTAATNSPTPGNITLLDRRRQFALGMIETGNRDGEVGQAGEVSRYQIMPSVWKHYSDSEGYRDPEVSLAVAQQHWSALCSAFKQQAHREPDDFDMYVLWNTRYGYYASKGFHPARLQPVVRDRAQRFVNLLTRSGL